MGDRKISIAIWWCGCVGWQLKFFGPHKGGWLNFFNCLSLSQLKFFNHHRGVTKMGQGFTIENFQSPSYSHYFSDGDWFFSFATKWGCHMFWESSRQKVFKNMWDALFLVIEKLWLPFEKLWQLDGDHISLSHSSLLAIKTSRKGFTISHPFSISI